jgi:hypothetical protein
MATTLRHPTLPVRGRVFLQRGSLVRRLAAGASPSDSPERGPYSAAVPLRRAAILRERAGLLGLAADLRDTGSEVNARGVALVERLLSAGGSPLYVESEQQTLEGATRHARAALLLA